MRSLSTFLIVLFGFAAMAQISTPLPSPAASVMQEVGLTDVTIEYCRPGVKDRMIFGDLVPFDKLWRTGANGRTKITVSNDLMIAGKRVQAGTYSIFSIPGEEEWTIIINNDVTSFVGAYDERDDLFRFKVKPTETSEKVERMQFSFVNITDDAMEIRLEWNMTRISFMVTANADETIVKEIESAMEGISYRTYYDAAMYYLSTDRDLDKALTWVDKALEKRETYWMVHGKAKIQAAMGEYKEAIKTAERSKELAKESESESYMKLNDKAIAKWKDMK